MTEINILKRRPRNSESEYVLVDRGEETPQRFVVGTATPHSLSHGEWFWGHYFNTMEEADQFFERPEKPMTEPWPTNMKSVTITFDIDPERLSEDAREWNLEGFHALLENLLKDGMDHAEPVLTLREFKVRITDKK